MVILPMLTIYEKLEWFDTIAELNSSLLGFLSLIRVR